MKLACNSRSALLPLQAGGRISPKGKQQHRQLRQSGYAGKWASSEGRQALVCTRGVAGDAVQGWVDLAKLVSGGGGFKSVYKELAQKIGRDIYIDVNGWHLFLRDVSAGPDLKLHQALAQQIGEQSSRGLDLEDLLKKVPVKIGGGKAQVSLYEAIPSFSLDDLKSIVADFEKD